MERPHLNEDQIAKMADAAAGTAIAGFAISWTNASEAVTIVAGIFAAIAGGAAAWFHVERALQIRRQRRHREAQQKDHLE